MVRVPKVARSLNSGQHSRRGQGPKESYTLTRRKGILLAKTADGHEIDIKIKLRQSHPLVPHIKVLEVKYEWR